VKKILVVDGSACTRKFISLMLKAKDYITYEAEDGLDALEKLSSLKVDLVITERDMPNMDGLTFARSVRNNFYFLGMPLIMVTERMDEGLEGAALRAGVDGVLLKPVTSASLVSYIESVLKERVDGRSTDRQR
jgi:CheY-like chemotaxis protein